MTRPLAFFMCLVTATLASAPAAAASGNDPSSSKAATPQAGTRQIVIRLKDGGSKPEQFCMPAWSVANETATDVGDLLVQIEWRRRSTGEVLQPVGQFGTMVRGFKAGMSKDMFANGYQAACRDLQMVVATYACRDASSVRQPCPGPVVAQAMGTVAVDTSRAKEDR